MISFILVMACAGVISFAQDVCAGEKLVYAVVYKGRDFAAVKTEIFSFDTDTSEKTRIFSDEKTSIVLVQRLYVFHFPVAGGSRLFAHAAERNKTPPFPGNSSLYELSRDGSNAFRKMCPALGDESLADIFVNSTGDQIGYLNRMNGRQYFFIVDIATGKLLNQTDITDVFLDCHASTIGWIPRSEMLYFTLETGDEHVTSDESYARAGVYRMDERGGRMENILRTPAAKNIFTNKKARLIGFLPTGDYIFETMQHTEHPSPRFALIKVKADFSSAGDISFSPAAALYSGLRVNYSISPSGGFISAAKPPVSSSAVSCDIWLKNLRDGIERKIVSIPTAGLKGPFPGIAGWLE